MINKPNSAAAIIQLLQDMERRSQQAVAGISQQDTAAKAWTAMAIRVGQYRLLLPLGESKEVFPVPEQITAVPAAEDWVIGIANLRGDLLPLFDLQLFLQGTASKVSKKSRILVINHPDIVSGVLVDEVSGLKHFQREPEPINHTKNLNLIPYCSGRVFQQDIEWDVFSLRQLLTDPRFLNAAA